MISHDDDDDFSPLQQKGFSFEFILTSGRVLSIHTNPYQALMIFTQKLTNKNCRKGK